MKEKENIDLVVVEDHEIFRKGLIDALSEYAFLKVVAQLKNGEEAINYLRRLDAGKRHSLVVLMDLETQKDKKSGIRATRAIINSNLGMDINVVALTTFSSEEMIMDFLNAGGIGFLDKIAEIDEIVIAIEKAAKGEQYIAKDIVGNYLSYINRNTTDEVSLSPKLIELLRLCEEGKKYKEIADETNRTLNTIHTHARRIRDCFAVDSMAKAIIIARKKGII